MPSTNPPTPVPTKMAWVQVGNDIDGIAANDTFGYSVSLSESGSRMAVGAYLHDRDGLGDRGLVRVFLLEGGEGDWIQLGGDLLGDSAGDRFGNSVSISGNGERLAVGSVGHDGFRGQVKLFEFESGNWNLLRSANISERVLAEDTLNPKAAITSDECYPAIYNADTTGGGGGGPDGRVDVEEYVDMINALTNDSYPCSFDYLPLVLQSNWITVSCLCTGEGCCEGANAHINTSGTAPQDQPTLSEEEYLTDVCDTTGNAIKFASAFQCTATLPPVASPTEAPTEAPIDGEGDNLFKVSVSLSFDGNIVAVGARINDDKTGGDSGPVRVFQYTSGLWTQLGDDIDGEDAHDDSGYSVSLSSDGLTVVVGAYGNDGENGSDGGHVRIYTYSGSWKQVGQDLDGEAANDWSGFSVSLSANGNIVAVGAIFNDGINAKRSGHVRIYEYDKGEEKWSQRGSDIDGEAVGDKSGYSVSLSSDGSVVAVGAIGNDENGDNSGHVRIHKFNGNDWVQVGADIDGEAKGDKSGESVSLSGDGNRVAIGARWNDANGNANSGHARVYNSPRF